MENKLNLSQDAIGVIQALQHKAGILPLYTSTLITLSKKVLAFNDEMEMSSDEAIHTLRALNCLVYDLVVLAGANPADIASESNSEKSNDSVTDIIEDVDVDMEQTDKE